MTIHGQNHIKFVLFNVRQSLVTKWRLYEFPRWVRRNVGSGDFVPCGYRCSDVEIIC